MAGSTDLQEALRTEEKTGRMLGVADRHGDGACPAVGESRKWARKKDGDPKIWERSQRANPYAKQPCEECNTLVGVKKWRKGGWHCKAHWPLSKVAQAAAKKVCKICKTSVGVRKARNEEAYYCKLHRQKIKNNWHCLKSDSCQKCGKPENLVTIKATGAIYCRDCLAELRYCPECGKVMTLICRKNPHLICEDKECKNSRKNKKYNYGRIIRPKKSKTAA